MSKIEEFRSFMHEINVDAFMLHTKDEYLNEYSKELAAVVLKVNRKIDVAVNKYLKFVWAYLFTAMLL
ncbi:MAG: hypothetical protein ACEY3K_16965, partial [Wolbachia sp.]